MHCKASAGAIYPALQQLEDEELVTSGTAGGKRTYSLTDAGKAELEGEAESVKKIWQRAEQAGDWGPWMGPEGAEVMRPAAEVMKTALKAATRGSHDSAKIAKIREILERAKREIEGLEKNELLRLGNTCRKAAWLRGTEGRECRPKPRAASNWVSNFVDSTWPRGPASKSEALDFEAAPI